MWLRSHLSFSTYEQSTGIWKWDDTNGILLCFSIVKVTCYLFSPIIFFVLFLKKISWKGEFQVIPLSLSCEHSPEKVMTHLGSQGVFLTWEVPLLSSPLNFWTGKRTTYYCNLHIGQAICWMSMTLSINQIIQMISTFHLNAIDFNRWETWQRVWAFSIINVKPFIST